MPTKHHHVKGDEFPPGLQAKFNIKSHQLLTVTIEVEEEMAEYDVENLGDTLIEGFKEILAYKKGELEFPPPL